MAPTFRRFSPPVSRTSYRLAWLILGALAALMPVGCGQPDEIAAYDVPKPDTKETEGKNRLLVAILLGPDETAWHFKLVGPRQQMNDQESAFRDFLQTVRFDKKGEPTWTVPKGWEREPNRRSRFAAFKIGEGLTALELTVVRIPAAKGDLNLLTNVNRWRRQLHRQPIEEETLAQFKHTIVVDGKEVPLIALTGSGSGKTPRPPDEPEVVEVTPSSLTKYDTPAGWVKTDEQDPAAIKVGVRRAAAFKVADGNMSALVTVIPMPNTGRGAIRPNLDRWADQVGLPPLSDDDAQSRLKPLTVDGRETCFLIDLVGPPGAERKEILAAVVALDDKIWTFKMIGPPDLVTRQKAAFEAFVRSAKFEGGR